MRLKKAKDLNEGGNVMIEGEPCEIKKISRSAPGKHGHVKIRIEGRGILDGKKRTTVEPGDEDMRVPRIEKKTAQVLSKRGEKVQLMDSESYDTFTTKIPEDFEGTPEEGGEVLYWDVEGERLLKKAK